MTSVTDRDHAGVARSTSRDGERLVAVCAVALLSSRIDLHPMLPLGYAVALGALPVTVSALRQFRGATAIVVLSGLALVSGALLTWLSPADATATTATTVGQALRVLMIGAGGLMLLWARHVLGARPVVLSYALGWFVSLGITGVNPLNVWKFSLSVPIALLVLSLPFVYRRPWAELTVLVSLGAISAVQDSRSAAAQLLVAAALVLTGRQASAERGRTATVLLRLALAAGGGFFLLQAALLRGDLGEEARQRTMEQIDTSGSVLLGGRPELGATLALFRDQPWGHGLGAQPSPHQVDVAKSGMAALGYDPDNGYVERFMLGDGFELHSVTGNLWSETGIIGILLAVVLTGLVIWGMARHLSQGLASGIMLFLVIRLLWDVAFSPLSSSLLLLMLCWALALPVSREEGRPAHLPSG